MNKTFRSIWNETKQAWVATSEIASSRGNRSSSSRAAPVLCVLSLLAGNAYAACTTSAVNQTLTINAGSGCDYIGTGTVGSAGFSGGNIVNNDNISTVTGAEGQSYGNLGPTSVYLSGGTVAHPNVFTNNGTITNSVQSMASTASAKALMVKGSANVFNNGSLIVPANNNSNANGYNSAILYWSGTSADVFNLSNQGTITAPLFGIYSTVGTTNIINGSSSNSSASIGTSSTVAGTGWDLNGSSAKGSLDNWGLFQGTGTAGMAIFILNAEMTNLTNESTGRIVQGISNSGRVDALNNYGSIDSYINSSTATTTSIVNYAGGTIGILKNYNGTIGSLSNAGTITTLATGSAYYNSNPIYSYGGNLYNLNNSGTITTLTNYASISSSTSGQAGIYNTGVIGTLNNNFTSTNTSIDAVSVAAGGSVGYFNNGAGSGSTQQTVGSISIDASSSIATLRNYNTGAINSISNNGVLTNFWNNHVNNFGGGSYVQSYTGVLPVNYLMYIQNSTVTPTYSQMAVTSGTGQLTFGFNLSSLTFVPTNLFLSNVLTGVTLGNINTNAVASPSLAYLGLGFVQSVSNGIEGTVGGTRNWWLLANSTGGFDLCFDSCGSQSSNTPPVSNSTPDIVSANNRTGSNTGGFNLLSNVGQGNFNNRFDGGTLRVDGVSSSANFTITANKGYIDQYGGSATLSGVFSNDGSAQGRLVITNSNGTGGVVALTNTGNSYSGGTEVQAGATLSIADPRVMGTGGLDLIGSSNIPATLQTTADMQISAPITVAGDPVFNVAPGTTLTISSPIADGGTAGDVVADGGGTLALTAVNTYTGTTTINPNSTLALSGSGSIATSSAVTNNGTLSLTGKTGNVALGGTYTQGTTGTLSMNFSASNNQQLNVTGAAALAGTLTLNPSAGSYTAGRYTLLTASSVTGTFSTFNANLASVTPLSYSLSYDPSNVYLVLSSGPSAADTQNALAQSASSLRSVYNLQSALLGNSLNYDCGVFAANNVCVSAGGRYPTTSNITGEQTSTLLVASYRAKPNLRLGAFIDQNVSTANVAGISVNSSPLYGLFGVWNENPDATGFEVRLASSWTDQAITQTRNAVGTSEAGVGASSLSSRAISGVLSYAVPIDESSWVASPYAGLRKTRINRSGYTEMGTIVAPLTYGDLTQSLTTMLAGVRMSAKLSDDLHVMGSLGIEHNVSSAISTLDATGVNGLVSTDFSANYAKTRPAASVGASYEIRKEERLSFNLMYRKEAFQSAGTTSGLLMYQVGL